MKKTFSLTLIFLLVVPVLLNGGCRDIEASADLSTLIPPKELSPATVDELTAAFESYGYGWDRLEHGVPPLILTRMPADMDRITDVRSRKKLFFLALLPMALMLNEEIDQQRQELIHILARIEDRQPLSTGQLVDLQELRRYYKVRQNPLTSAAARQELRRRVAPVPPSLLLAQAANESGFGTSRFARDANNLFGEWTFTPGTGLVPAGRPEGASYEVRVFPSIYESLRSYLRNINTHWAYRPLRALRAELLEQGQQVSGTALVAGLELYSARRGAYVDEIRTIIRHNQLQQLARATLRTPLPIQRYRRPGGPVYQVAAQ